MPEEIVRILLESVEPRTVFGEHQSLSYFIRFIEQQSPSVLTGCIIPLWNRIAQQIAFDGEENSPARIAGRLIVERIPVNKRFRVTGRLSSGALLRSLAELNIGIALVPDTIWPADASDSSTMSTEDAYLLLDALVHWKHQAKREEEELREISLLAATIWKSAYSEELVNRCGDMPLFRGTDALSKKQEDFSYRELRQFLDAENLFSMSVTVGYAYQLQSALDSSKNIIRSISKEIYTLLFPESEPQECTFRGIQQYFKAKTRTLSSSLEDRRQLFSSLSENVSNNKLPLRFLLHGNAKYYNVESTLFFPGEVGGIFGQLNQILSDDPEEQWKYLSSSVQRTFGEILSGTDLEILNISHQDKTGVVQQLGQCELNNELKAKIAELKPSLHDYKEILLQIKSFGSAQIRELPIHETIDGRFSAVEAGKTFLEPEEPLDPTLKVPVTLLKRRKDAELLRLQHSFVDDLYSTLP